jgi:hypothetical protein
MLEALAHFVVGGMVALTARDNECAVVFPRTDERSGPNRAPPHPQAALSEVGVSAPFFFSISVGQFRKFSFAFNPIFSPVGQSNPSNVLSNGKTPRLPKQNKKVILE